MTIQLLTTRYMERKIKRKKASIKRLKTMKRNGTYNKWKKNIKKSMLNKQETINISLNEIKTCGTSVAIHNKEVYAWFSPTSKLKDIITSVNLLFELMLSNGTNYGFIDESGAKLFLKEFSWELANKSRITEGMDLYVMNVKTKDLSLVEDISGTALDTISLDTSFNKNRGVDKLPLSKEEFMKELNKIDIYSLLGSCELEQMLSGTLISISDDKFLSYLQHELAEQLWFTVEGTPYTEQKELLYRLYIGEG